MLELIQACPTDQPYDACYTIIDQKGEYSLTVQLFTGHLFSSRPIVGGEEVRFLPLLIVGYQRLVFTRGVALIELMQWAAIYLEMIMRGELIEEAIVPKQSLEKIIDQICSKRLTTVSDICESAMDP